MNDELSTMMLALAFAAVMVIAAQMFTAQTQPTRSRLVLEKRSFPSSSS